MLDISDAQLRPNIQYTREVRAGRLVDLLLHGLAVVRLINPSEGDIKTVVKQIGLTHGTPSREPDLTIRFVDRISTPSGVRFLDNDDVAFTDDAFLILPKKYGGQAKARIAFEEIGSPCEIICETGIPEVPFLVPIFNLILLGIGIIALHASAFVFGDKGIVATGWSKGGKTETLLAFMAQGAQYIGDEWIYIDANSGRAYGTPRPFGVWGWCLNDLPRFAERVSPRDLRRLRTLTTAAKALRLVMRRSSCPNTSLGKFTRRTLLIVEPKLKVNMVPEEVFGTDYCALSGAIDTVLLVVSHEDPRVTAEAIDINEVIRRMVFSLQYERREFMACYAKFRFAFPEVRNDFIERNEEIERAALTRALLGKEAYALFHPYPVSIPALFNAAAPICR